MTLSKRLALLGVRSVLSVSKPRGLGSSYDLSDCRPFPYRQISEFTKDSNPSKNSQMETLQDSSPKLITYRDVFRRTIEVLRGEVEKMRGEVEKMRAERAKAGLIDRRPLGSFYDFTKYSNPSKNSLEHHLTVSCPETIKFQTRSEKMRAEREEEEKMRAEREELEKMLRALVMYRNEMDIDNRYRKRMNECNNEISMSIRRLSAQLRATKSQIAIWGTATAVLMPALLIVIAFRNIL